MKIDFNDNKTIIYLKNNDLKNIDFNNLNSLEEYFKGLLLKLRNIYQIELRGYYIIKVYIDSLYGMILELEEENIDYDEYYSQIEMRIIPYYTDFLYKIDNLININHSKIYLYKNELYLKLSSKIPLKDYLNVMEHAKIVYNNTDNIISLGRQINRFNFNNYMI